MSEYLVALLKQPIFTVGVGFVVGYYLIPDRTIDWLIRVLGLSQ